MSRQEILEGLREIILAMNPEQEEQIKKMNEDSLLFEDLGLSSVSLIYMVMTIEDRFNIEFTDIGVEDFKTVGQTIDYIEKKQK